MVAILLPPVGRGEKFTKNSQKPFPQFWERAFQESAPEKIRETARIFDVLTTKAGELAQRRRSRPFRTRRERRPAHKSGNSGDFFSHKKHFPRKPHVFANRRKLKIALPNSENFLRKGIVNKGKMCYDIQAIFR
ncbi:MAG: hypothetical protein IJT31_04970 [Oscillibacter sp.]|nr:hypothetical protein [Oscillibacter sp.]